MVMGRFLVRVAGAVVAAGLFLGYGGRAEADLVTVEFLARVTAIPDPSDLFGGSVSVGDLLTGSFTYDTTAVAAAGSDPFRGDYSYSPSTSPAFAAPLGVTFTLGGVTIEPRYTGSMIINLYNDNPDNPDYPDAIVAGLGSQDVASGAGSLLTTLILADATGTAFSSDALPPSLSVEQFTAGVLTLANNAPGNSFGILEAEILPIPEPGSLALLGLGGLGLLVAARRRQRRTRPTGPSPS